MPKKPFQTKYIILRKIPFQESSLVVAGLSLNFGRLDFLLKGARIMSRRCFPEAELFREFDITFTEPRNADGIAKIISCEPVGNYDSIAASPEHYMVGCSFASFLLKNTRPMLDANLSYLALKSLLFRMTQKNDIPFSVALAKFACLYCEGLLPDEQENTAMAQKYAQLLEYATHSIPLSPTTEENRKFREKFNIWVDVLCDRL